MSGSAGQLSGKDLGRIGGGEKHDQNICKFFLIQTKVRNEVRIVGPTSTITGIL